MKIFNFLKKNKNKMMTEDQLISYKQNFTGQQFQWIKTDKLELMGKVVKCRDVRPDGMVIFDDGSMITTNLLNTNLMMIHGDMKPLSMDEVSSINPKPRQPSKLTPPEPVNLTADNIPPVQKVNVLEKNPFEMFDSDEIDLMLKLRIKMPDKKLLKMMYNSATDKNAFLEQLSNYVNSMINNTVVNESLKQMLDPKSTTKVSTTSEVKLTEVSND